MLFFNGSRIEDLALRRVAIHVFEGDGESLRLIRSKIPLTAKNAAVPTAYDRFQEYFLELVADATTSHLDNRQAVFEAAADGTVAARLEALYRHPDRFQTVSIALADGLLAAIHAANLAGAAARSARRSAYFLFAEFGTDADSYYAILRLDYDQHIEVDLETAGRPPELVVHTRDLPTSTRLNDKLAIIVPPQRRTEFDLLVTDRKADRRSASKVARYFLEQYLGAQLAEDSRFCTEVFIDTVKSFARRHQSKLAQAKVPLERYFATLEQATTRRRIHVAATLADLLPGQAALGATLRQELAARGLNVPAFRVAREVVDAKMSRRSLVLANGIRISGDRETMNRRVEISPEGDHYAFHLEADSFVET